MGLLCSLTLPGPWAEEGEPLGSFHCPLWRPYTCRLVALCTPAPPVCFVVNKAGLSLSLGPGLQKGCLGPQGRMSKAYHAAFTLAAALPISRACAPPREGSLGVDGRRYTMCTRPCSASFAASPFSSGSMKNSSSSMRIRPACRAKMRWFRFSEHSRQGSSDGAPEGSISHLTELGAGTGTPGQEGHRLGPQGPICPQCPLPVTKARVTGLFGKGALLGYSHPHLPTLLIWVCKAKLSRTAGRN